MEVLNDENIDEVKQLEAQIKNLEAEVEMLQEQQKNSLNDLSVDSRGSVQDALSVLTGRKQSSQKEVLLKLKAEVAELEEDLHRQTDVNGFSLESCSIKTLQGGESEVVRQFKIVGSCSELEFTVEFNLTEKEEGRSSEKTITGLNVVMDNTNLQHFSSFLSGMEERNDLLMLFRTIRTFSNRCDDRCRTFLHFQEKYPSVVALPGGSRSEVMSLQHPELPSLVFSVHWSVRVSADGVVLPKLDLLTKIPEEALQQFPSLAAGGAAEGFHSLLRLLGPEAALESIIRALRPPPEAEA
ncbi:centromere protein P [Neosynchiropus ocellatus]